MECGGDALRYLRESNRFNVINSMSRFQIKRALYAEALRLVAWSMSCPKSEPQ